MFQTCGEKAHTENYLKGKPMFGIKPESFLSTVHKVYNKLG